MRADDSERLLAGYVTGPAAATEATAAALPRAAAARAVVLVEGELIRAAGTALAAQVLAAHGDLAAFRTIQRQPAWRGRDEAAQLRRFLGAGSQRKLRYARLLTEAIGLDRMPPPLTAALAAV